MDTDYQQTVAALEHELARVRAAGDRTQEGQTLDNLGEAYRVLGQYDKALDYFEQAVQLRHELDDHWGETQSLTGMALVYLSLDERENALAIDERILALRIQLGDRIGEANTRSRIGTIYWGLGEESKAIASAQHARALYASLGLPAPFIDAQLQTWGVPLSPAPVIPAVIQATDTLNGTEGEIALTSLDNLDPPMVEKLLVRLIAQYKPLYAYYGETAFRAQLEMIGPMIGMTGDQIELVIAVLNADW